MSNDSALNNHLFNLDANKHRVGELKSFEDYWVSKRRDAKCQLRLAIILVILAIGLGAAFAASLIYVQKYVLISHELPENYLQHALVPLSGGTLVLLFVIKQLFRMSFECLKQHREWTQKLYNEVQRLVPRKAPVQPELT